MTHKIIGEAEYKLNYIGYFRLVTAANHVIILSKKGSLKGHKETTNHHPEGKFSDMGLEECLTHTDTIYLCYLPDTS